MRPVEPTDDLVALGRRALLHRGKRLQLDDVLVPDLQPYGLEVLSEDMMKEDNLKCDEEGLH